MDGVQALGMTYVAFAVEQPAVFRLMSRPDLAGSASRGPSLAVRQAARESFGVLVDHVVEGQRSGRVADGEPRVLALSAWAAVHGLAVILGERLLDDDHAAIGATELARAVTGLVLDGLRRREPGHHGLAPPDASDDGSASTEGAARHPAGCRAQRFGSATLPTTGQVRRRGCAEAAARAGCGRSARWGSTRRPPRRRRR
ncbi:MAG: TetR-like C-terminal domain-containing protein [Dermatophilaceae bacterium]